MKFVVDLLEPLAFVGLLLGFALALTLVVAALSWTVEAVLRHRIGFYLGYVVMVVLAFIIVGFAQSEIMECGLFKESPGGCELSSPNCYDCEFSLVFQLLSISFMFVTIPLLIVSQIKLKKWSQSRHT